MERRATAGGLPAVLVEGFADGRLLAGLTTAERNLRHGDRGRPEVARAYAELEDLAAPFGGWVRVEQVHGADVVEVPAAAAAGATLGRADGMLRREGVGPGLLTVTVADCVPVYLAWPGGYGLLHAGWRGTSAGVLERALSAEGVDPSLAVVHLGVSIGACCYEVGRDVVDAVRTREQRREDVAARGRGDRWLLDLRGALAARARAAGVPDGSISASARCTACGDGYHSFRASGEPRARRLMLAFVGREVARATGTG